MNNTEIKQAAKRYTKAEQVVQAYDDAAWYHVSSEGCYSLAIAAAHELGGVEIYNSNDDGNSTSFAPTRTFAFDDASSVYIECGGVWS